MSELKAPLKAAPKTTTKTTRTSEVLRFARVEKQRLALSRPTVGEHLLVAEAEEPRALLDGDNGLVDVDAGLSLAAIGRLAERLGVWFPLARPLPAMTLQAACNALPYVTDALVHSADIVTVDGQPFSTPHAPRAATGPGLTGALCTHPPLGLAVRARLRVYDRTHASVVVEEHADDTAAASRVLELLEEGRALAVDAQGAVVRLLVGNGSPLRRSRFIAKSSGGAWAHLPARVGSGRAFGPGAINDVIAALARGARVVASPPMGRIGTLERTRARLPIAGLPAAIAAFVSSLEAQTPASPLAASSPLAPPVSSPSESRRG